MCKIEDLYDLSHTAAAEYLKGFTYPWEALKGIKDLILSWVRTSAKRNIRKFLPPFGCIRPQR